MSVEQQISVLGTPLELILMERTKLRGINADMLLNIIFYEAVFHNEKLCVIKVKDERKYTPLKYRKLTDQIEKIVNLPVVLWIEALPYYERERLISQGVYFIISDQYAFLPTLVSNVRSKRNSGKTNLLTPAAQYLLIYYLLQEERNEFTLAEWEKIMPYNYLALARAVVVLEETGLCNVETDTNKTKHIQFNKSKKELWNKAQAYLSSPVKKRVYSDSKPEGKLSVSGLNALSNYSRLNPAAYGNFAVWEKDFKKFITGYNDIEGLYEIEIWKYPSAIPYGKISEYVDKLSLYLSLKDNPDPRVEKELGIMIETVEW